jgi:dienelactone hydrolase
MKLLPLLLGPLAAVLLAAPALAADPKPGSVVTVTCKDHPDQKYSCYVPKAYSPSQKWPILYCFAPDANGQVFVQQYKDVCERRGWIVVGSLNSKNGPWGPIKAAIDAMWADTESRFSLHPKRRYASGFSGGARVSFALAEQKGDFFSGVIAIGAGLSSTSRELPGHVAAWLMCGESDFNKKELDALMKKFEEEKRVCHYENYPGEHVLPPRPLMEKAVEWIDDQAEERRKEIFDEVLAEAGKLREAGDPVQAWIRLVGLLEKYPDLEARVKQAEKLRKTLERDDAVKGEAAALSKYESAMKWIGKNRDRIAKSKSARAQAEKKLGGVVEKYPGTLAADRAEKELAALPKPEK